MLRIRQYRDSDQTGVWELHNVALTAVGAHAGNGPWDDDFQHIKEVYLDNGGEFLVGEYEGQIVAMGALKRTSDTVAEVKRVRVHPSFQRRGFGTLILQTLENRARELGYATLHLDTTVQQIAAKALYTKHGFKQTRREWFRGTQTIFMEKPLQ